MFDVRRVKPDVKPETRPRLYYSGWSCDESSTADEVIDARESDRIDTGLLDASGNPIFRRRPTVPFGFVR